MYSRREILKIGSVVAASTLVSPFSLRAATKGEGLLAHGLFFDEDRVPVIRQLLDTHPLFSSLRRTLFALDFAAERAFLRQEVEYNNHLTHITRVGDTAEIAAMRYLLSLDEDAASLAIEAVQTLLKFPKWDFLLEGGKDVVGSQRAGASAISIACVSDWLGSRLSDEERKQWAEITAEKGCKPCYLGLHGIRYPRSVAGWGFDPESTIMVTRAENKTDLSRRPEITQTTNLRAVPAGGLAVGLAFVQRVLGETEEVTSWKEMAIHSLRAFADIFEDDGSYDEGITYSRYTATHLAIAITVLERLRGDHPGDIINWRGYADYLLNMSMPTTIDPVGFVNFGDNGNAKTGEAGKIAHTSTPFWIASRFADANTQWFGENLGGLPDLWTLFWYQPDLPARPPASVKKLWVSDLQWVVARTGYASDDLVVALRSGGPANHEHADRNTIVVKCFGEELVTDPYRPPYSYSDPAWSMRLTGGHSAVLVDGRGHQHHNGIEGTNASNAYARLLDVREKPSYAYWESDASLAYRLVDTDIALVERKMVVLYEINSVIVVDHVTKHKTGSATQSRFFGFNWDNSGVLSVEGNAFLTRRPGAKMKGTVWSNEEVRLRTGRLNIPEERAVRHPFVEVASLLPATKHLRITVLDIKRPAAVFTDPVFEVLDSGVRCRIPSHDGGRVVEFDSDGTLLDVS